MDILPKGMKANKSTKLKRVPIPNINELAPSFTPLITERESGFNSPIN